jgi:formylglycine-generating enzyme required for sulfatase activity
MKKIQFIKIFFPILCVVILLSFTAEKPNIRKDFKDKFSKVKPDLFVCKYEVSNLEYRGFLDALLNSNQLELYKKSLPDSLAWVENNDLGRPLAIYYFRHQAYNNYPVVGITYENALEYCQWLTTNYNSVEKRPLKKVVFQLLTKADWMFAASAGDSTRTFPWGSGFIQNNRKQDLCNYRHAMLEYDSSTKKYVELKTLQSENLSKEGKFTTTVNAYFPNTFGLYNMSGNVAEMVEERGIAKGGSFIDLPYQVMIKSERNYAKTSADIGFRVSMKILKN